MAASRILGIMTDSFLDGISGAALFGKLRRPGAPTVLVDSRSPSEANVEYESLLSALPAASGKLLRAREDKLKQDAENARMAKLYREQVLNENPIQGVFGEKLAGKKEAKGLDGQTASFSRSKP